MKRTLSTIILLLSVLGATAQNFESNGIRYRVVSTVEPYTATVIMNLIEEYTGDIVIPATVSNAGITYTVTEIAARAFAECAGITSVTLPETITTIKSDAFTFCSGLTTFTLPESVTYLGFGVFSECVNLTSINIPNAITVIYDWTFNGCNSLTSITIPDRVDTIGASAFADCLSLTSITIPEGVKEIGFASFFSCIQLHTVNYNAVNASIETLLGDDTIYYTSPFLDCVALSNVNIGANVETIPMHAFQGCTALKSVSIPSNVTKIEEFAFDSTGLEAIYMQSANPPQISENTFANVSDTISVYVPCGTINNYSTAAHWDYFTNIIEAISARVVLGVNNPAMGSAKVTDATCETDMVTIEAFANAGYRFVKWSDESTESPRTLTVTEDITLIAIFESTLSIHNFNLSNVEIFSYNRNITVKNAEGQTVEIYDALGRRIMMEKNQSSIATYSIQTNGIYIVRVGGQLVRKVIIN